MMINAWTQLASCLMSAVPASMLPAFSPSDSEIPASLAESHLAFRRLTESQSLEGSPWSVSARLWGGMPLIAGLSLEEMAGIVAAAGAATLVIRGIQKFWESRNRPFGDLKDLNRIFHEGKVVTEKDARTQAGRMARSFLKAVRAVRSRYENAYFQVPYSIAPNQWSQIDEKRHRLTGKYLRQISEMHRQFSQGLNLLSRGDFGNVYEDVFGGFLQNVSSALGPLIPWEDVPTREALDNFDHFRKVLRREVLALEMKLEALSEPQAV